jgi:hypothetical protein
MPPFSAPILNDCHFLLTEHVTLSVRRDETIPVLKVKYNTFLNRSRFREQGDKDNVQK